MGSGGRNESERETDRKLSVRVGSNEIERQTDRQTDRKGWRWGRVVAMRGRDRQTER